MTKDKLEARLLVLKAEQRDLSITSQDRLTEINEQLQTLQQEAQTLSTKTNQDLLIITGKIDEVEMMLSETD